MQKQSETYKNTLMAAHGKKQAEKMLKKDKTYKQLIKQEGAEEKNEIDLSKVIAPLTLIVLVLYFVLQSKQREKK